jgi:hypothetical protein
MRLRLMLALVVILTLVCGTAAQAGPIVIRPLDSSRPGEFSNLGPADEKHQQVADRFILNQAATIESITWYGRYDGNYDTAGLVSFSVRVFVEDLVDSPSSTPSWMRDVEVLAEHQGTSYLASQWLTYSTAPDYPTLGLTLGPGIYWLSIVEKDAATSPSGGTQWLWGDTSGSGLRATRGEDGDTWSAGSDWPHAFTLEGTVPDPGSTLLLLGISLVGLRAWRRRLG